MKNFKKWLLLFAGAAVLIGCAGEGGGAGGDGGGGGGGGGTSRAVPTVNLGSLGDVQVAIISGAGRRAVGSQIAVFRNISFQNGPTDFVPAVDQIDTTEIKVQLDGYTLNSKSFTVSVPSNVPYRSFTEYPFEVYAMEEVSTDSGQTSRFSTSTPAFQASVPIDVSLKVFPGRQSTIQMNLDDTILSYDIANQQVVFDSALFQEKNYDVRTNSVRAFVSDLVSWDISHLAVADRPTLTNGRIADKILFSGDSIAIASGLGDEQSFELLDPVRVESGVIRNGPILNNGQAPGVYTLIEPDPRDLNALTTITALQGSWRPHNQVLKSIPAFSMVCIPGSDNDSEQQLVAWSQNTSGQVTKLWQGIVRFDGAGAGTFDIWPVTEIVQASPSHQVSGTVSNLVIINGIVRSGDFKVTGTPDALYPFPLDGSFVVFRR